MSEDVTGDVENTAVSHDVQHADSSTAQDSQADHSTGEANANEQQAKPNGVQKRINELTRQKHEERIRADDLERRLNELESKKKQESTQPDLKAPIESEFESYDDFQIAQAEFVADSAAQSAYERLNQEQQQATERQKQEAARAALQDKQKKFLSNLDEKRANFQDFDAVAYGHEFMDQSIAEMIFESDKGPEVAYHLGSNLDEAERIFNLQPLQRMRELTKLELQLASVKPKLVSTAPDPIKPLGGSEAVGKDPDKMTTEEWLQWRRSNLK